MGCGGSSPKHDYSDDVGPDGPLSDSPPQIIVSGHKDALYNGLYSRGDPWNGKAMYQNLAGRVLYYHAANEGGAPGWSFDNRNQLDTRGSKDWYHGGFFGLEGGPAFPPLCAGGELADNEEGEEGGRVSVFEMAVAMPPPTLRIDGHPHDGADGLYTLASDLWNARPHYVSSSGWCFYYYASNEGGSSGWSLHDEDNPGGQQDLCAGGWVGPFNWSHPPVGPSVGFNDVGRCTITAESGDASVAAHVQQLLMQYRQGQLTMLAPAGQVPMMPMMQPAMVTAGMPAMMTVTAGTPGLTIGQPVPQMAMGMAVAQPVAVAQPMVVATHPAAMTEAVPMAQPA